MKTSSFSKASIDFLIRCWKDLQSFFLIDVGVKTGYGIFDIYFLIFGHGWYFRLFGQFEVTFIMELKLVKK